MDSADAWPALPFDAWTDTRYTLHMCAQMLGKVRLALAPREPDWAHSSLKVDSCGISTGTLYCNDLAFEIGMDCVANEIEIQTSQPADGAIELARGRSVASIYAEFMRTLRDLGIDVSISTKPQEVANPIPFDADDAARAYDPEFAARFRRALGLVEIQFERFRAPFEGRHTNVQFFWGTFDLAYTRYFDKPGDFNESGFWFGDERFSEAAFYSFALPKRDGVENAPIEPPQAFWSEKLGEFLLRYDDVRATPSPEEAVQRFLNSTFRSSFSSASSLA